MNLNDKTSHLNKLIEDAINERNALGHFEFTVENKAKIDRFNELSEMINTYVDQLAETYRKIYMA